MRGTQFAELSAFVAVAEQRSFSKAAAQLGISRPSISEMVRSLEERLGVRLLNRTTRSVALTEAGERLLADAEPILDAIDKAIDHVGDLRDKPRGMLRLNMQRAVAVLLIGPLLAQFLAKYPDIKIEISADDSNSDIVSGRFDAGIRRGDRIAKDMIAVKLLDEQRAAVVASPAYLAKHPLPVIPHDLLAHNCVRLRTDWNGGVQPWDFEKDGHKLEATVDGSLILNDWFLVLHAVLDGLGIGYFPEVVVSSYIANGRLTRVMQDWCGRLSGVFLYYPSRRQVPGPLRAFIDFMHEHNTISAPPWTE
ncbi:MAG TPA: LysR family transcriptional regulator [Xanthobacteraceae bacterium]|jgi:DNA-binding transcriptional LysR family regulator|nr:LysR family transcriptional regulator [Xanthobacteraceae bacterium]